MNDEATTLPPAPVPDFTAQVNDAFREFVNQQAEGMIGNHGCIRGAALVAIDGNDYVSIASFALSQRTIAQNKRLHALIEEIAQHPIHGQQFGVDAIKEYVRRRWIGTEEVELPDGTRIERGISTTTLSVEQCARLMEAVEAWAVTELGIELQHP